MTIPSPIQCFEAAITKWEGGWQDSPHDGGNYTPGGKLVGTMRGVTVSTYAAYLGVSPETITPAQMQSGVTLAVAAEIYRRFYFEQPGFARLSWSPLAEIAADIGWGSGPAVGIHMLQRLVGTVPDGVIGAKTAAATAAFIMAAGLAKAADGLSAARAAFYVAISMPGSRNAPFRAGWLRRADWYTSGNPAWWPQWTPLVPH
ncbi:MAG: hypothetical protein JO267_06970 [Alphaproteobacteria bacterium]|nr:hypothetical protein [Alphaproteobacteria bacterium]